MTVDKETLLAQAKKVLRALPDDTTEAMHVLGVVVTQMLLTHSADPDKDALSFTAFVLNEVKQTNIKLTLQEMAAARGEQ